MADDRRGGCCGQHVRSAIGGRHRVGGSRGTGLRPGAHLLPRRGAGARTARRRPRGLRRGDRGADGAERLRQDHPPAPARRPRCTRRRRPHRRRRRPVPRRPDGTRSLPPRPRRRDAAERQPHLHGHGPRAGGPAAPRPRCRLARRPALRRAGTGRRWPLPSPAPPPGRPVGWRTAAGGAGPRNRRGTGAGGGGRADGRAGQRHHPRRDGSRGARQPRARHHVRDRHPRPRRRRQSHARGAPARRCGGTRGAA